MKHLIKDIELIAYLEGSLSKAEVKQLKERLKDNDELDLLYHLQLSYEEGIRAYANELIGEDDSYNELPTTSFPIIGLDKNNGYRMVAKKTDPEKE